MLNFQYDGVVIGSRMIAWSTFDCVYHYVTSVLPLFQLCYFTISNSENTIHQDLKKFTNRKRSFEEMKKFGKEVMNPTPSKIAKRLGVNEEAFDFC